MNFVRNSIGPLVAGGGIADHAADLKVFLDPASAAAVWRRQTPPDVLSWLQGLDPVDGPKDDL